MTDNKDNGVRTNVLVVKPITSTSSQHVETEQSLNNKTKNEIIELALERFGIEFDQRTKKVELIKQFIEIQDKEQS